MTSPYPGPAEVIRFQENEARFDLFLNELGTYLSSNLINIETLPSMMLRLGPVLKNTSVNRPILDSNAKGRLYFDTTLAVNGKPIFWNGTNWVDFSGSLV